VCGQRNSGAGAGVADGRREAGRVGQPAGAGSALRRVNAATRSAPHGQECCRRRRAPRAWKARRAATCRGGSADVGVRRARARPSAAAVGSTRSDRGRSRRAAATHGCARSRETAGSEGRCPCRCGCGPQLARGRGGRARVRASARSVRLRATAGRARRARAHTLRVRLPAASGPLRAA